MDEAQELRRKNDTLPLNQRLSMRAIAKKVGISKITVIERLSSR